MPAAADAMLPLGSIGGPYGVRGWVRVRSRTSPPERILSYDPWYLWLEGDWRARRPAQGRVHAGGVIARLEGCDDRGAAKALQGAEVAVRREQLPALPPGEYYWADLIGLRVRTGAGVELGRVSRLMETGSNDVLVVAGDRERLIPYLPGQVVRDVDLAAGTLVVDWDPDF